MSNFKADSKNGLDLGDLGAKLPIKKSNTDGKATWLPDAPPRFVGRDGVGRRLARVCQPCHQRAISTLLSYSPCRAGRDYAVHTLLLSFACELKEDAPWFAHLVP